jgi:glucose/mannose-6-phosphate isomerase
MKKHIENFYKHIQDSYRDFDKNNFDLEEINKVVVAGMGGSAIAGLILRDLFPELEITVERNYFPNTPID